MKTIDLKKVFADLGVVPGANSKPTPHSVAVGGGPVAVPAEKLAALMFNDLKFAAGIRGKGRWSRAKASGGGDDGDGQESERDLGLTNIMVGAEWTDGEIEATLRWRRAKLSLRPHDQQYFDRTIAKAREGNKVVARRADITAATVCPESSNRGEDLILASTTAGLEVLGAVRYGETDDPLFELVYRKKDGSEGKVMLGTAPAMYGSIPRLRGLLAVATDGEACFLDAKSRDIHVWIRRIIRLAVFADTGDNPTEEMACWLRDYINGEQKMRDDIEARGHADAEDAEEYRRWRLTQIEGTQTFKDRDRWHIHPPTFRRWVETHGEEVGPQMLRARLVGAGWSRKVIGQWDTEKGRTASASYWVSPPGYSPLCPPSEENP